MFFRKRKKEEKPEEVRQETELRTRDGAFGNAKGGYG